MWGFFLVHDSFSNHASYITLDTIMPFSNRLTKCLSSSGQLSMGLSTTSMFWGKESDWSHWWWALTASTRWVVSTWPRTASSSRFASWSWTPSSAASPVLISSLVSLRNLLLSWAGNKCVWHLCHRIVFFCLFVFFCCDYEFRGVFLLDFGHSSLKIFNVD